MCDEDYWRKEAERLRKKLGIAYADKLEQKVIIRMLFEDRAEARRIARVLYRLYLASQIFTWDELYQKLIRQAKRELPWL